MGTYAVCNLGNIIDGEILLLLLDTSKDQDRHYWDFDLFDLGLVFENTSSECKFLKQEIRRKNAFRPPK